MLTAFFRARYFSTFTSRSELEAHQLRLLQKHFAFLREHSPFYKTLPMIHSLKELEKIPIMHKNDHVKNFDLINTVGARWDKLIEIAIRSEKSRNFKATYKGYSVGLSSGTSGHRGAFIVSTKEQAQWAGTILAKMLPNRSLLGHKVALFLRANNNLYESAQSNLLAFRYFDTFRNFDENCKELAAYQPTILIAPPSVLARLADKIETGEIELHIKKLVSVAEVLELSDEQRFKRVFKQSLVHQIYQCTEGFLACTCPKGSLHLNEQTLIIEREYIDKSRFVPIITDLKRTSQPIVRYRLNDILVGSDEPCACESKSAVLKRIIGREDDSFYFRNNDNKDVLVFADLIARCMLYASGFAEYRVKQIHHSKLEIYIDKPTKTAQSSILKQLQRLAKSQNFTMPDVVFHAYKPDYTRKLKRIERVK